MRLRSVYATLAGILANYAAFYVFAAPLLTEAIAEWIMARTPSRYAIALLAALGPWAKPAAVTGGLAVLGFAVELAHLGTPVRRGWPALVIAIRAVLIALGLDVMFGFTSLTGSISFWLPAVLVLLWPALPSPQAKADVPSIKAPSRRHALAMFAGIAFVSVESFVRNRFVSASAAVPVPMSPMPPRIDRSGFAPGLVRKAVTPIHEFYGMSKNTVDPAIRPEAWRLRLMADGKSVREWTLSELYAMPRTGRYVTLRCVSNTLKSDLMGTAFWSGISLAQLLNRGEIPANISEIAFIGVDGHGDSMKVDEAFASDMLLAMAMNGETLNRDHGFPIRLLAPRYYGFKSIKWLSTIELRSTPYFGTWTRMGYTREPYVHTGAHVDRYRREGDKIRVAGVAFAGIRGISSVQIRAGEGPWTDAQIEPPLSPYTLVRWYAELSDPAADSLEVRAQDGTGAWQADHETPLFPNGVSGPTRIRLS